MKILIVEDEPLIRETLQELLQLNGHSVLAAADGPEGIRLAQQAPDLIFCDIGLPGKDGYEVLAEIRALPVGRETPFIFLTARADRSDQRHGMALGADDYITKPFSEKDILDTIRARIRRQQPLRERIGELVSRHRSEVGAEWSHELMTPLNGVLGGLELIEAEADSIRPTELRELLAIVRAGAERQHALARKLVLYFELERLRFRPLARPFSTSIPDAVADAAERVARLEKRTADLKVNCEPGSAPLAPAYLAAAVAELVENACRFSRPGQPVLVSGSGHDGRYRIAVCDHGPGLTADQQSHIAPFVQFDRPRHNQQGLGLGLAIARATAELTGGGLELESAAAGQSGLKATLDLVCGGA